MLTLQAMGPTLDGRFLVVYQTPGCCVPTVACDCMTQAQADSEVDRLNKLQVDREEAIRRERELCGLVGVYQGLETSR
jgi:hypothetical protein